MVFKKFNSLFSRFVPYSQIGDAMITLFFRQLFNWISNQNPEYPKYIVNEKMFIY